MNILVVCLGNIWRSPLCAAVLSREKGLSVKSVAFLKGGRRAAPGARDYAQNKLNVDLSEHRSQQITAADIGWADIIVCMNERHIQRLKALVPRKQLWWVRNLGDYADPVRSSIPDPNFISDPIRLAKTLDLIYKASTNLGRQLVAKTVSK
jgi:protein-tyrosine-phosphatase